MNEKSLKALEWPKVRERVALRASFSLSRDHLNELEPMFELEEINTELALTSEAVRLLWQHGDAPFGGASDVRSLVNRAQIGGILGPEQFLPLGDLLYCSNQLRQYLAKEDGVLSTFGQSLTVIPELRSEIERCIDPEGDLKDQASPELARIRSQMRTLANRIRERMDSLVHSAAMEKILQETIITMRGGRYVVPVKSEYRNRFQGIVHDQSGSGATLFMEPSFAVELNNDLNVLEQAETVEVQRILKRLTAIVGEHGPVLLTNLNVITKLDCIFAKARYSRSIDGVEPEMNDQGKIFIKQGRHPLLTEPVVPIDVWLGDEFRILIITGPNTGGKTVTLKTVGLFSIMAQSGLHIPALTGSKLAVFEGIYADIGDEQSIEQSLSTFSSHMTSIVEILKHLDENSLVLLDELGAGTDPTEGAALATAILDYLQSRNIHTIATTHYSALKTYAYTHEGVENASVEFDLKTLQPTYRLAIGIPGKSNAFAISQRLGLNDEIVEKAQTLLPAEHMHVEDLIGEMESNRRQASEDRLAAEQFRRQYEELKQRYDQQLEKLEEEKIEILEQARTEARELLKTTQAEMNQILGTIRQLGKDELEGSVKEYRQQITSKTQELQRSQKKKVEKPGPANLKIGEEVRIKSLRQTGFVLEKPNAQGEVQVQAGIMKITVQQTDLERLEVDQPKTKARTKLGSGRTSRGHLAKSSQIRNEIDLRGKTVEESLALIDKYLDDAFLSSLARVQIIHGKGTGALAEATQNYLASHPNVQEFRYGSPNEGGHGVTIVDLYGAN